MGMAAGVLAVLLFQACVCTVSALNYGLMIDAGSSGSRIYVFNWPDNPNFDDFLRRKDEILSENSALRVRPGLSSFNGNLAGVRGHLSGLIDFAKEKVPQSQWHSTPVYLGATAGMRLVPRAAREAILTTTRNYLGSASVPFRFNDRWAKVISGEEEAVYAWVAANTILKQANRAAVVELGGASMQVVFEPESNPIANKYELVIQEERFQLYAVSFLTWGVDQAFNRWVEWLEASGLSQNPCGFRGQPTVLSDRVITGTGDFNACVDLIAEGLVLKSSFCPSGECSIHGVHQPPIDNNTPLYAVGGGWFFPALDLGCSGDTSVNCWIQNGPSYCAQDWQNDLTQDQRDDTFFPFNCFKNAYTLAAFQSFGLRNNRQLSMVIDIEDRAAAWTLGAMTYELGLWEQQHKKEDAVRERKTVFNLNYHNEVGQTQGVCMGRKC